MIKNKNNKTMQEDPATTRDASSSYPPSPQMSHDSNVDHGVCAASSPASCASAGSLSLPAASRSGSAVNSDSSSPFPEATSPLPSASSVMVAPLSTTARRPLIGDSSCLSFDFDCSCPVPEGRANKTSAQHAAHSGTESQACRLMAFIGSLILLSVIISQFIGTRRGNYAFSLTCKFGRVEGEQIFVPGGPPVIRYLGIPFAVPPVNKLRFQPSQVAEPLAHLNNSSFRRRINLAERARSCPQDGALVPSWLYTSPRETSEDCLYMNLWTPDTECLFQGQDCGSRAVIVFFHGGDLRHTGNRAYDGAVLSAKADVVVAVPNYRLGLLGHSAWNESEFMFLGLGDQLTAVRWLRENVGIFGGNASRLVLAGHGAGAASVGHWMLSTQPEVADVERFIMISGSPYARYMKDADVIAMNLRTLARRVQCESYDEVASAEEIIPCLRRLPSSVLVPRLTGLNGRVIDNSRSMDDIPTAQGPSAFRPRGSLLLGTTPDEGYHFVGPMMTLHSMQQEWMLHWLTSQGIDNASVLLNDYERELGTTNSTVVWTEAYADIRYRCPMRRFAERMAGSGVTVHWFVFDAKPSFGEPNLRGDEAGHYTTVRLLLTDLGSVRTNDEDIAVRDSFVRTLGSFVNTGQSACLGGAWAPKAHLWIHQCAQLPNCIVNFHHRVSRMEAERQVTCESHWED
ncbi:liver carboxylesterase 1-like [Dermacentor variabilis]|uniref:liver carboxylesterase 1-like n=1 Tax=Dermacentor variabilis TaxID=34621 RepID=UPI003F5C3AAF